MASPRVVVTGLGAVSSLGLSVSETWEGLCSGRCGIARIRAFDPTGLPCELAGELSDYRIQDYVPKSHRKAVKLMCRDIELAVMAAREAVASSGLVTKGIDPEKVNVDPTRMAINLGSGIISCSLAELGPAAAASTTDGRFDIRKWGREGLDHITPLWLLKYLPNMLACHIGIIHDIQGPSNTITCGETSAHIAIGEAAQVIARGAADTALTGGAEAKVNVLGMLRQDLLKRSTSVSNDHPATACRPFDANATGSVFGESGAVLMLESLEHARQRGATILAEVVGIGQSQSLGPAYECLEPDGKGLQIAIEKALADADVSADMLDLIVPHGTGIPCDDRAEANAIQAVLGAAIDDVPVWPTKSLLTTTGAGAGVLDVVAALCAMKEGMIPAARNFERPAEGCRLRIATEPQKREIRYALSCSYSYGGQTAAVLLKRFDEGGA